MDFITIYGGGIDTTYHRRWWAVGGRTTRQRMAVMRVLSGCQDFVSAQELHGLLVGGDHSIGLTTVYRALRELEAEGGVDVVRDEAGGGRLYRLRPADGHRHYLMCRDCGRSRPVDSDVVEHWAGRIAADTGFTAVEHTVELTGICAECRLGGDEGELSCQWDRALDAPGRARGCAS
ncbi:Fur family transcriptional regulator [Streptomyces sp. TP-A0356]|uniref:Fur family transcriptional regulator n=1 Tax=Streptomyces sp. TP-A0356 TaxID=1359208 RepID=UPI00099E8E0D|nr:Fur family transcriptional regulator [Streptomyces sp. TP-A0356]